MNKHVCVHVDICVHVRVHTTYSCVHVRVHTHTHMCVRARLRSLTNFYFVNTIKSVSELFIQIDYNI